MSRKASRFRFAATCRVGSRPVYQDVLPADGWMPDARLDAEIGGYVFTRERQTIAIRISESDSNTSTLTVFAKTGEFRPARR